MYNRRSFLKLATTVGAGAYVSSRFGFFPARVLGQIPGGTLPPGGVPKFVTPLRIPLAMPRTGANNTTDFYTIAVRQFSQQVLPSTLPQTTVWGYGAPHNPATFGYPACTVEAKANRQVRVQWKNELVDRDGNFLPHLLPVDQTLHWANPVGGVTGRDMHGHDPTPYRGPVPLVTHLHGAHAPEESDGYPEAWYLPAAANIPAGFASVGSWYDRFRAKFGTAWGGNWEPGSSTYVYPNDQRATTLWFHDHTLGMTRVNVYAGPTGFYLIRGGSSDLPQRQLPGPAPSATDDPSARYYEIPLVIQDRSFNADGSLFYPNNRAFFEGLDPGQLQIPFIPDQGCSGPSDVPPIWNPEFFGNMTVVNGQTWPYLDVEQRRYRFRLLNGCGSRFLILKMNRDLPFWQIGADGGLLPAPARLDQVLMGPSERADVIVDFTNVPVGTEIILLNIAPDEPFGGGVPGIDFEPADPASTGMVMQFRVVSATSSDTTTRPDRLVLPKLSRLGKESAIRKVSLNEAESATVLVDSHPGHGHRKHMPSQLLLDCGGRFAVPFGPTMAQLGTVAPDGSGEPLRWMDGITENPALGATEVWEIHNFTADAHPIHMHLAQFEIISRQDASGGIRTPEAGETGTKDTVISYPGEVTRLKARFDKAGQFVWHCHILEHEDNEMMRPYRVGPE